MKAVLMNSADKIKNTANGPYIGMQKTIVKTDGTTWLQSDARDSQDNQIGRLRPLDNEMGTGQLNVGRAVTQFASGRTLANGPVPAIGWDYNFSTAQGNVNRYQLPTLPGGAYISITLVWDRTVTLTDAVPNNGKYDPGEPLNPELLTDLDIYLVSAGVTDYINQNIWSSETSNYNVEHIFFQLGGRGPVDILVVQRSAGNADYALAWWGQGAPAVRGTGVNQGADQRSRVTSLTVTFNAPVTFAGPVANAFTLTRTGGGGAVGGFTATASLVDGVTVVTLAGFTGAETRYGSLADGRYTLTALASQITYNGRQLDGNGDGTDGDDYTFDDSQGLFRYYGDVNGDQTVNGIDFGEFRDAFGTSVGDPNYRDYLDFNADGAINGLDFDEFRTRFGIPLP